VTVFSSCVVWPLVRCVIMNERDCEYVTCCAPVGLTFLVLGLREREIKLFCKRIFPRNMLESRVSLGNEVWETLLPLNREYATFYLLSLTDPH
jgi:hypothetical protein